MGLELSCHGKHITNWVTSSASPNFYLFLIFKNVSVRAGEMTQRLRALDARLKDLASIPNTYIAAHSCL